MFQLLIPIKIWNKILIFADLRLGIKVTQSPRQYIVCPARTATAGDVFSADIFPTVIFMQLIVVLLSGMKNKDLKMGATWCF